jgi:hypothetical protein
VAQPVKDAAAGRSLVGDTDTKVVPQKLFTAVAGYAIALTLLFVVLWLTGRLSLSGGHQLESLPDIKPLARGEFQSVPESASLPNGHELKLGETRRYGDVLVTPTRVTREVITVVSPTRPDEPPEQRTETPVLKLWFRLENASTDIAFAPWDNELMGHRSPEAAVDKDTLANSWLMVQHSNDAGGGQTRVLNYLHPVGSPFQLVKQNSGQLLKPGESTTTFIASAEEIQQITVGDINSLRWRLQLRKGVNRASQNGVTTLVDVTFSPSDIEPVGA